MLCRNLESFILWCEQDLSRILQPGRWRFRRRECEVHQGGFREAGKIHPIHTKNSSFGKILPTQNICSFLWWVDLMEEHKLTYFCSSTKKARRVLNFVVARWITDLWMLEKNERKPELEFYIIFENQHKNIRACRLRIESLQTWSLQQPGRTRQRSDMSGDVDWQNVFICSLPNVRWVQSEMCDMSQIWTVGWVKCLPHLVPACSLQLEMYH